MIKIIDTNFTKVYYEIIPHSYNNAKISNDLQILPNFIQQKILKYTDPLDRSLRIRGKLLLKSILSNSRLSNLISLEDLKYTDKNKPFLHSGIDLSITHSGNIVVCAISFNGKIGIDIEKVEKPNYHDYEAYFTRDELNYLSNGNYKSFYRLWTRKESFAKATGEGIFFPFKDFNLIANNVIYENRKYYFKDLEIIPDYICSMCLQEI